MPSRVRRWSDRRREVRGTTWTKDEDAMLAEMLRSGMCVKDAAEQLGRTGSSVYHRIKNAGIANPSLRHWEQWEVDQLREAVASGLSAKEIAGRMGRTVTHIFFNIYHPEFIDSPIHPQVSSASSYPGVHHMNHYLPCSLYFFYRSSPVPHHCFVPPCHQPSLLPIFCHFSLPCWTDCCQDNFSHCP